MTNYKSWDEFETARILFFSAEVFVTVAVVIA